MRNEPDLETNLAQWEIKGGHEGKGHPHLPLTSTCLPPLRPLITAPSTLHLSTTLSTSLSTKMSHPPSLTSLTAMPPRSLSSTSLPMMTPHPSPNKSYSKYSIVFPSILNQPDFHPTYMDSLPLPVSLTLPGVSTLLQTPMAPGSTTSSTPRKAGYITRNLLCRPKLLGFLQLSQMVKGPHLNLAQFDLNWGHQIPWQKVVEEWKQEQLE